MGKALGARWVGAGTVLQWSFAVYLTQRDFFQVWSLYEHKINDEMIVLNPFVFVIKTCLFFYLILYAPSRDKMCEVVHAGTKAELFQYRWLVFWLQP